MTRAREFVSPRADGTRASIALTLALLTAVALASPAMAAQPPVVLPTAVHTIDLNIGGVPSDAPMAVAYYPGFGGHYYATLGGLTIDPAYVFDAAGNLVQTQSPINVDCRGISYNWNTNQLEVCSYNAKAGGGASAGLLKMGLDASGKFTGTNTVALGALPGLADDQTMPTYDSVRNRLYSRSSATGNPWVVDIVDRATGSLTGTVTLDTTGLGLAAVPPGGPPTLQSYPIGFDSTYSVLITVDTSRPRVLVYRLDGAFLGASALPTSPAISVNPNYGMGYANGQIFLFNSTSNGWTGYRVLDPPVTTSAGASTGQRQYSLVAFHVIPIDTTIAGALEPTLGGPDTTSWRFGHWLPHRGVYGMAGFDASIGQQITGYHIGEGYWLIAKDAKTVTVTGSPAPSTLVIPLITGPSNGPGWNQLGNPYEVSIPVSSLRVRQGTTEFMVVDPADTLTDQVVWTWNGSAYTSIGAGGVIPAGQGFWLRKTSVLAGDLILPRPGVIPGPALVASGPATLAPASGAWSVTLTAGESGRASNALILGAAEPGAARLVSTSLALPPGPPGGSLRLVVPSTDGSGAEVEYASSYQASAERMSWEIVLSGAEAPGELTLDVAAANAPPDLQLRLTDEVSGEVRPLTPGSALALAAVAGSRRYRVEATSSGASAAPVTAALSFSAYPNPFRAAVGLRFSLARPASIALEIYDVQGRLVRALDQAGGGAGERVLVWDGRDGRGNAVGSGIYLARWNVGGASGTGRIVKLE